MSKVTPACLRILIGLFWPLFWTAAGWSLQPFEFDSFGARVEVDYGNGCLYVSWNKNAGFALINASQQLIVERYQSNDGVPHVLVVDTDQEEVLDRETAVVVAELKLDEGRYGFCDLVDKDQENPAVKWSYLVARIEDEILGSEIEAPFLGVNRSRITREVNRFVHWPPVEKVDVLHSFGTPHYENFPDPSNGTPHYPNWILHEGIDFLGVQEVTAVHAGKTSCMGLFGMDGELKVEFLYNGGYYYDFYKHIEGTCPVDGMVGKGDIIGTVKAVAGFSDVPHLHYQVGNSSKVLNPLAFAPSSQADPHSHRIRFADVDRDGRVVVSTGGEFEGAVPVVRGRSDLIVDVYDLMCDPSGGSCVQPKIAPYRLEYWIEDHNGQPVVANPQSPYVLFDFGSIETGEQAVTLSATQREVAVLGYSTWPTSASWVVTNACLQQNGSACPSDPQEHWNTLAATNSGSKPNGSDAQESSGTAQRRFPNGRYSLAVRAYDRGAGGPVVMRFPLVVRN